MTIDADLPQPSESQSLHERIKGDISTRILSGEWQPGRRIPFEHELTVEYAARA